MYDPTGWRPNGNEVAAVYNMFFDLTKAFDSVPHRQLVTKLETIGLDEHLVLWNTAGLPYKQTPICSYSPEW